MRHGPHHVAQKLISTTWPRRSARRIGKPVSVTLSNTGAALPTVVPIVGALAARSAMLLMALGASAVASSGFVWAVSGLVMTSEDEAASWVGSAACSPPNILTRESSRLYANSVN